MNVVKKPEKGDIVVIYYLSARFSSLACIILSPKPEQDDAARWSFLTDRGPLYLSKDGFLWFMV